MSGKQIEDMSSPTQLNNGEVKVRPNLDRDKMLDFLTAAAANDASNDL